MPRPSARHLLPKKSWNVYNAANIERVRRDEAAARAREEAEEQRQQEEDSARRLAILRGEEPPAPAPAPLPPSGQTIAGERTDGLSRSGGASGGVKRKRKRVGEDDTDFEMRIAREQQEQARQKRIIGTEGGEEGGRGGERKVGDDDAPLVDGAGHIDLFPKDRARDHRRREEKGRRGGAGEKNAEAERELARKRREYEDQYTMRFANAAGRDGSLVAERPWYARGGRGSVGGRGDNVDETALAEVPAKDVWGNEDPRRREREAARVVASDPLAAMRRGAARVREVERERRRADGEREAALAELRREEKERRRERKKQKRTHERRRREERKDDNEDEDALEGFSSDGPPSEPWSESRHRRLPDDGDDRQRHRHRHRHERRSHHDTRDKGEGGGRHSPDRHHHRHRGGSSDIESTRQAEHKDRRLQERGKRRREAATTDNY